MAAAPLPFKIALGVIDRVTGPFRRIAGSLGSSRFLGGVKRFGGGIADATAHVTRLTAGFGAMAAAAGVGIFSVVKATADLGDELGETAAKLGVSTDFLQEMRFAAERAGVATENFDGGLGYLVRSIGQARAGTGALASLLERVSPSFLERLKASTNIEEQLLLVLEAIEAMPDASKRAALANAAFGRTGGDLVLMAEAGAEAIAALRIEAHRLGLVLDQEAIEACGRFDDAWIDANNTLRGLRNTVGAALIPAFGGWIAKLSELLVTYRPQIEDWAKRFAEGLPGRLQEARDWFARMIERLSPLITLGRQLAKSLGWVTLGVGGLSLVVFLAFLPAIIASTKAIFGLGAALLTTPVGWILLGIAAIVAAIVHWEEVLAWLGKAWDWFVGLLDHVFGPALEWWGERIGGVVDWAFESVKAGWARMTGWLSGAVAEVESWIPGWMRDFISGGSNSLDLSASLERADEARADRDRTLHQSSEALVTVQIAGAPPGTTVRSDSRGPLDLRTGVNLGFP